MHVLYIHTYTCSQTATYMHTVLLAGVCGSSWRHVHMAGWFVPRMCMDVHGDYRGLSVQDTSRYKRTCKDVSEHRLLMWALLFT